MADEHDGVALDRARDQRDHPVIGGHEPGCPGRRRCRCPRARRPCRNRAGCRPRPAWPAVRALSAEVSYWPRSGEGGAGVPPGVACRRTSAAGSGWRARWAAPGWANRPRDATGSGSIIRLWWARPAAPRGRRRRSGSAGSGPARSRVVSVEPVPIGQRLDRHVIGSGDRIGGLAAFDPVANRLRRVRGCDRGPWRRPCPWSSSRRRWRSPQSPRYRRTPVVTPPGSRQHLARAGPVAGLAGR
jgi:hypothetical protein